MKQAKYDIFAQFPVFYRLVEFSTRPRTFLSHVILTEISIMPLIFALLPVTGMQRDPSIFGESNEDDYQGKCTI